MDPVGSWSGSATLIIRLSMSTELSYFTRIHVRYPEKRVISREGGPVSQERPGFLNGDPVSRMGDPVSRIGDPVSHWGATFSSCKVELCGKVTYSASWEDEMCWQTENLSSFGFLYLKKYFLISGHFQVELPHSEDMKTFRFQKQFQMPKIN